MNLLKSILIWLNTPRSVDIPVFTESKDADLYDELRKRQALLNDRKCKLIENAAAFVRSEYLRVYNYMPADLLVYAEAAAMFRDAKEKGLINDFNEPVRPKEVG